MVEPRGRPGSAHLRLGSPWAGPLPRMADPDGGTISTEYSSGRSAGVGRMSSLYPSGLRQRLRRRGAGTRSSRSRSVPASRAGAAASTGWPNSRSIRLTLGPPRTRPTRCPVPLGKVDVRVRPVRAESARPRPDRRRRIEGGARGSRVPQREPYRHVRRNRSGCSSAR